MEEIIKTYLDSRAASDPLFAQRYANPQKSIEECCRYIVGEAYKKATHVSGVTTAFLEDADVLSLAVHYYDEDKIEITEVSGNAVPLYNGAKYEPTEEDKENARKAALEQLQQQAYNELHGKKKVLKPTTENNNQTSLFD